MRNQIHDLRKWGCKENRMKNRMGMQETSSINGKWYELLDEVDRGRPVKVHSDKVLPGDVFIAMPGTKTSGSEFVAQALQQGAAYIVGNNKQGLPEGAESFFVCHPEPREALGQLARRYYKTNLLKSRLIGITGTNGKTTVAYLLENLLQSLGYSVGVIGTVSYRWPDHQEEAVLTTPDCLSLHNMLFQMGKNKVDVVCIEVSSHALEQKRVAGLNFDWVVFTNLSQEHLDYHTDMETYFQAKRKLFYPPLAENNSAVVNIDDPYGFRLISCLNQGLGFGIDSCDQVDNSCLKGVILSSSRQGLSLSMSYHDRSWQFESGLIGRHNALNLLAAQAIGIKMGLDPADFQCLSSVKEVPGRLERVINEQNYSIFIDYAHTPDALENVLSTLKVLSEGKLIVVFGCGGNRDKDKRPVMGRVVAKYADMAVLTSDNPRHEDPVQIIEDILPGLNGKEINLVQEIERRKAMEIALGEISNQDILLIAGKGHETYQEIGDQRRPFSDYKTVQELLEARNGSR